jgi:hypothetical protein
MKTISIIILLFATLAFSVKTDYDQLAKDLVEAERNENIRLQQAAAYKQQQKVAAAIVTQNDAALYRNEAETLRNKLLNRGRISGWKKWGGLGLATALGFGAGHLLSRAFAPKKQPQAPPAGKSETTEAAVATAPMYAQARSANPIYYPPSAVPQAPVGPPASVTLPL